MIIAVIGLGYVGAPLAVELSKHFTVIGQDINQVRIKELEAKFDRNGELSKQQLADSNIQYTIGMGNVPQPDVFIITVPTPVAEGNVPDLGPVCNASMFVGKMLKKGNVVIYESTVYPGVTEEICVPRLEEYSGLKWKEDFNVGYSPERINPGDKVHRLTNTVKIVAGDTAETLEVLNAIYGSITETYQAPSIKVAEAAKVIENTQRDVNIALMNEFSQIFTRMNIDTNEVIDAAASKWNFLPFRPGLVGGHCISVDPYYLSHKAATQGFVADLILSAREINDSMPAFIVDQLIQLMVNERLIGENPIVTILGVSFKENVSDIRNSKVIQIVELLRKYGIQAQVVDPIANEEALMFDYRTVLNNDPAPADAIILAVPHEEFTLGGWELITALSKPEQNVIVMDLKSTLDRESKPEQIVMWRP